MAAVSAKLVKELRERTGLGMMECKKSTCSRWW
jgi:elongation factor Ts